MCILVDVASSLTVRKQPGHRNKTSMLITRHVWLRHRQDCFYSLPPSLSLSHSHTNTHTSRLRLTQGTGQFVRNDPLKVTAKNSNKRISDQITHVKHVSLQILKSLERLLRKQNKKMPLLQLLHKWHWMKI